MKTWFVTLALLCAAGLAQADGMPDAAPAAAAEPAPAPAQPQAKAKTKAKAAKRKPAHMPHGDLRHCLDLSSNIAIIRCAEKPAPK